MNEFKEILGRVGYDKVTGFKGVITGVAAYMTGCNQYLLRPKVKDDGSMVEGQWFDSVRIKISVTDAPIDLEEPEHEKPGADQAAPMK